MNASTLINDVPAEQLLGLGLFFGCAALILVALSAETGNYRDFSDWVTAVKMLAKRRRLRRRWTLSSGATDTAPGNSRPEGGHRLAQG